MKLLTATLIFLSALATFAQTNEQARQWKKTVLADKEFSEREYKSEIMSYDFARLWTDPDNSSVYGYIGNNYQRLRIKIISAVKDKRRPDTYLVSGKSKVRDTVRAFSGTIRITNARIHKQMHWGIDDEYLAKGIKKQGIIFGEYHFSEEGTRSHTGTFDGVMYTAWYIDGTNRLRYDDIQIGADGYRNNQFVGTWTQYNSPLAKTANWGDFRVPLSGDLDGGAGEFSPTDKYLKYGWQSHRDAYLNNDAQARKLEEQNWW